jgi:glucose/arabinose dehydrogenase
MRLRRSVAAALAALFSLALAGLVPLQPAAYAQATGCQYVLGFLALHQLIPTVMGDCVDNEMPAPNGDSLQHTTNGLAVYRKADNWTAFTDGNRTWINGPSGLQQRLNTQRFSWEADAGAPGTTVIAGGGSFNPAGVALRLEPYVRGLSAPLLLTYAPDGSGRQYVVEKRGTIRLVDNGQIAGTFLNIQSLVNSTASERGLLGLAFHPRYRDNGWLYVDYTDTRGDTMIVRYTARPDRLSVDPGSAQTVMRLAQPAANHNGGNLVFGPDGYLWIGTGDGGGAGDIYRNAQNPQTLLGKMLRIDVNRAEGGKPYAIPADNPYAGNAAFAPEIWATGMRNPWRYTFDRATNDLYIADVGQGAWEEIDIVPAGTAGGLNFGWPRMEGLHCYGASQCDRAGLFMPVAEYDHSLGCSITGGYVYRGQAQPLLDGAYLFGDYCSGRLWTLSRDANGTWVRTQMLATNVQISSFGEDEAGEVYVTGLNDGTVYRIAASAR